MIGTTPNGPIRVTVWNENVHERLHESVRRVYPAGLHEAIAGGLRRHLGADAVIATATMEQPDHGLTPEVLEATDVLTWWGHMVHEDVSDTIVERIHEHVLAGMGILILHSGHESKIFRRLMGTTCALRWREAGDREVVWTVNPTHPIAAGVPSPFIVPQNEMYGEFFDIPQPDELVFVSSFEGHEVFRSGCCFKRGFGRVFYFSPGHETFPVYHQPEVQRVIANGVRWAFSEQRRSRETYRSTRSPLGWYAQEAAATNGSGAAGTARQSDAE